MLSFFCKFNINVKEIFGNDGNANEKKNTSKQKRGKVCICSYKTLNEVIFTFMHVHVLQGAENEGSRLRASRAARALFSFLFFF